MMRSRTSMSVKQEAPIRRPIYPPTSPEKHEKIRNLNFSFIKFNKMKNIKLDHGKIRIMVYFTSGMKMQIIVRLAEFH